MQIIVKNLLVDYSLEGQGPIVVLLHGWGSNRKVFNRLSAELSKQYTVISVDFPGFGGSQQPHDDWYIKDYSQFVSLFLRKLVSQPTYALVGHSFGGRVIIKGISEGVLNANKIVLMGSAGIKPQKTIKQKGITVIAKVGKAVTDLSGLKKIQSLLRTRLYKAAGTSDYLQAGAMRQIFLNTINEDLSTNATKNDYDTLLLWGRNDTETPIVDGKKLHDLMSNSRLEIIDNAGHYVFLDASEQTHKLIKRFLTNE